MAQNFPDIFRCTINSPTKLVEKKESIRKIVSKSQRYYSDTWKGATHPLVEDTSITPSTRSRGKFERAYTYK